MKPNLRPEIPFDDLSGGAKHSDAPMLPRAEDTIAWVKATYPSDHIGAALFGLGRIAEALERIATVLEQRAASDAGL